MTDRPLKRFYWRDAKGRLHWSRVLPGVEMYAVARGAKWEFGGEAPPSA
jgi:hypothetical protein